MGTGGIQPVISVAIPVWNAAATIGEQVDAVLGQDCPVPFEVVVADNGSSDGTRDVVESIASRDHRVRIVDASAARGEAFARNAAVQACRARWVACCDADDVVRGGWLAAVHRALSDGAHAVNVTREQWSLNPPLRAAGAPETICSTWVAGGAFAVRRGLFLQLGGFDTSLPTAADTEFGFRLFDRMGRHPQQLREAVVSVRLPEGFGAVFARSRRLGRVRVRLRRQHPTHLSPRFGDVMRVRVELMRRLVTDVPRLATPARAGWAELAGALVGEVEGSVVGVVAGRARSR